MRDDFLFGKHILIVEDDYLQACNVEAELLEFGALIVGPTASLEEAFRQLSNQPSVDAALVDLKLADEMAFPIIDELVRRGIPLAFVTGYDATIVPFRFRHIHRCAKPTSSGELARVAGKLIIGHVQEQMQSR